jgi:hypothetical protein
MSTFDEYERLVTTARNKFADLPVLREMWSPSVDAQRLHLFLIHFSAFGVGMTEPVEGWIHRAGERCIAVGMDDLGRALQKHAKHEAGHHTMMIDDTKLLVGRWNEKNPPLDAEALLRIPAPPGVRAYIELHERVISGPTPYGQLAIEYEIERLSAEHGAPLIKNAMGRLGESVLRGMSFLEEHVAVDVGHTKFNATRMAETLRLSPAALEAMVSAGSEALDCYGRCLSDCAAAADRVLRT